MRRGSISERVVKSVRPRSGVIVVMLFFLVFWLQACGPSFHSSGSGSLASSLLAPSGFQIKGSTYTQIALGWTSSSPDLLGFKIERARDLGGTPGRWIQIARLSRDTLLFTDAGLSDGTWYWYRVRAFNAFGHSNYSGKIRGFTLLREPSNLSAYRGQAPTEIELSWTDQSSAEEGFEVERAEDLNGSPSTWGLAATLAGTNIESYRDTGLTPGTKYWYRVNVYNTVAGDSIHSNEDSAVAGWGIDSIVAGGSHSLALRGDGTVWAWGRNFYGQLGNGTNSNSNVPVQVTALTDVTEIAAGWEHSLALMSNGSVWAWGGNISGQLGNGTNVASNVPVRVTALTDGNAIAAGGWHSLALQSDGSLWAWGGNLSGQLGNGTNLDSRVPIEISSLSNVTAVAAGFLHSLALENDDRVWAFGYNGKGQLGSGLLQGSNIPIEVLNIANVVLIAAGDNHSLALDSNGTAWAWGDNLRGQLGIGTNVGSSIPLEIVSLSDALILAGGGWHSLALDTSGNAWAWGGNTNGQLGNGSNLDSTIPVAVAVIADVTAVSAGFGHSLAVDIDGTAWAFGYNGSGQLGNGTWNDSNTPVAVIEF